MKCNLCGAKSFRKFLPAYVRSVGLNRGLSLVQCASCGLVFLNPQPNWESLKQYYPDSYYHENNGSPGLGGKLARAVSTNRRGVVALPGRRLLDVGCGNGDFLLQMKMRGMQVFGLEPGRGGFEACRARGLDVQNTFLEESRYEDGYFDVVTLNHVLEHVPDPMKTLSKVRRLLSPSGVVVIQVPNLKSLAFLVSKEYFIHLDVPRHLFQFTPETLKSYLAKSSLMLVKVRYYASASALVASLWLRLRRPNSTFDKEVAQRSKFAMVALELLLAPLNLALAWLHLGDSIEVYAKAS